ncbi:MAG: hypothetical protein RXN89_05125 [Vulcanisaeta sp.]|nr:MAG: hypothetical protein AT717_07035 [Vulcanisaeta sp. CIS_19]
MPRIGELGISLLILGIGLSAIGYLVLESTPILVLGISVMIMGVIAAWGEGSLERTQLELSKPGWDNVSMLLESLGAAGRAMYLPSNYTEFKAPVALVPLVKPTPPEIRLPRGFTIRYGREGETGLILHTPGTIAAIKCSSVGALGSDLGASLTNCVVNHLAIARGIMVTPTEGGYTIAVRGSRVNELYGKTLVKSILGSPTASIIASIAAEALGSPIMVDGEELRGNDLVIRLRVLTHGP